MPITREIAHPFSYVKVSAVCAQFGVAVWQASGGIFSAVVARPSLAPPFCKKASCLAFSIAQKSRLLPPAGAKELPYAP